MLEGPDAPPRRRFLLSLLAIPAALAACAGRSAVTEPLAPCPVEPAAVAPRGLAAPPGIASLREVPLARETPPAMLTGGAGPRE